MSYPPRDSRDVRDYPPPPARDGRDYLPAPPRGAGGPPPRDMDYPPPRDRGYGPPPPRREPPRTTLFVAGFPPEMRAADLAYYFERLGPLVRCDIPALRSMQSKPYAFIEFEDPRDAAAAHAEMHGVRFGGNAITIQFAKNAPSSNWRFDGPGRDGPPPRGGPPRRQRSPSPRRGAPRDGGEDRYRGRDERDRDYRRGGDRGGPPRSGGRGGYDRGERERPRRDEAQGKDGREEPAASADRRDSREEQVAGDRTATTDTAATTVADERDGDASAPVKEAEEPQTENALTPPPAVVEAEGEGERDAVEV